MPWSRRSGAAGGEAVPNYDSVATREGAAAIVATAVEAFGAVHGLVNNAGILRDRAFHKMSPQDWDAVLAVHLNGAFHVTRQAWPHFREQHYGRVVMATSTSGLYGNFGQANYGSAKSGLVDLLAQLPPAQVAPVVGYLLTDECTDSGTVLVAGGGNVHRVALYQSKGVTFGETPTIGQVAERWSEITDLDGSVPGVNPVG